MSARRRRSSWLSMRTADPKPTDPVRLPRRSAGETLLRVGHAHRLAQVAGGRSRVSRSISRVQGFLAVRPFCQSPHLEAVPMTTYAPQPPEAPDRPVSPAPVGPGRIPAEPVPASMPPDPFEPDAPQP